ncbi:MAG TPA: hypothetical protein VE963_04640 [Reyranella sp.]|nr:hypothetical protein [Reyranella sp.]
MLHKVLAASAMLLVSAAAQAQTPTAPTLTFERAVFITCREAHDMKPEVRRALGYYLLEYSARYRGVTIPEDSRGAQIGYLVRGGCTLAPDAYLFSVIDRAVVAELKNLPRRQ